jgi:hypothetical protein
MLQITRRNSRTMARGCLLAALCLGATAPGLAAAAAAQPAAPAAQPAAPAAIEGSPAAVHGLTGTWNRYPQLGEAPDPKLPPPPPPVPPPPLKAQYKPDWDAKQQAIKEADARGEPPFTDYVKCLPDGMPTMMIAMFPMEVLQTPGQVTIMQEAYNQVRRIYLNEKQIPIGDAEPGYWGHSVGHWEGNTLVVDTVGIKQSVTFRGVPHSDQMRIHERIQMVRPDFFEDHITVEDPVYLTAPWSFTYAYTRLPHYKMLEYVCDSNREYKDPKTGGTRMRLGGH